MNGLFEWIDTKLGPKDETYKRACAEDREMIMDCILESECYKKYQDFMYCARAGMDKECKSLRHSYFRCRRATVFWEKSLRDNPR